MIHFTEETEVDLIGSGFGSPRELQLRVNAARPCWQSAVVRHTQLPACFIPALIYTPWWLYIATGTASTLAAHRATFDNTCSAEYLAHARAQVPRRFASAPASRTHQPVRGPPAARETMACLVSGDIDVTALPSSVRSYEFRRHLQSGAFGAVWHARSADGTDVAVKVQRRHTHMLAHEHSVVRPCFCLACGLCKR